MLKLIRANIERVLVGALIMLVLIAVGVILSGGPELSWERFLGISDKYAVLKTIGFCIVGVASLIALLYANKRANAIDATAKNAESGLRQERMKNAIEHLGHASESVRMGGAYELFHLAKENKSDRDFVQNLLDILCGHIRHTTRKVDYQKAYGTEPSEEIQSLLTLLFVQNHDVFEDCRINLQGSYLHKVDLVKARLKKANFMVAHLQGAGLIEVQLQGANLRGADLQGATICDAFLQGVCLAQAQLQRANLNRSKLQRADFELAQLNQFASLWQAQLQGASFRWARLRNADLHEAKMQGVNLTQADLQKAKLMDAQLQGANLEQANMQNTNLSNVQMQGAYLGGAKLQEANLNELQLQGVRSQKEYLPLFESFESAIKNGIGKDSDLTGIVFSGGLKSRDLELLCKDYANTEMDQALQEKLSTHIGQPASAELHEDSGAVTGYYTKEEAEQWIAEYNDAV